MVDIFLKFDSMQEGVLLRFVWAHDLHVNTQWDYDADWIYGTQIAMTDNGTMVWVDRDDWEVDISKDIEEYKNYATYVEFERLMWAVTDADGNPVELPKTRLHSEWDNWTKMEELYSELSEFKVDWDSILRPPYKR